MKLKTVIVNSLNVVEPWDLVQSIVSELKDVRHVLESVWTLVEAENCDLKFQAIVCVRASEKRKLNNNNNSSDKIEPPASVVVVTSG